MMLKHLKLMKSMTHPINNYTIFFTLLFIILLTVNFFVPSEGFPGFILIMAFVYWISLYNSFVVFSDRYKISEFLYTLPMNIKTMIRRDLIFILITNVIAYSLWSLFLTATDRIFMLLPLLYMISISIFSSVMTMNLKYLNVRLNGLISIIIHVTPFIFYLTGYMPMQNLFDRGMLNTHSFYFTWLPVITVLILVIFIAMSKRYVEQHAQTKHLLWSD